MRVPVIEHGTNFDGVFREEDFAEVCELIESTGLVPPTEPADLNGIALMARDEKYEGDGPAPIVAFIWALAAKGVNTAFVDYFAVKKELTGTMVGAWLFTSLLEILRRTGVKNMKATMGAGHASGLKILTKRGGVNLGMHSLVTLDMGGTNGDQ